jgi:integrase
MTSVPNPTARPYVRRRVSGPHWYAKWSRDGRPVVRAVGRAWVELDGAGGWRPRRGRPQEDALTEAQAAERMLKLVREHHEAKLLAEHDAEDRRRRGVTFRELARDYLCWMEDVKGAKPSTLRDHQSLLAEPGQAHRRGQGRCKGRILAALGDRPAAEVTTREIEALLSSIARSGAAPRTVNKARALISAVFSYGMRPSTYSLPSNPATHADRRAEPDAAALSFFSVEQIESLASAMIGGRHRDRNRAVAAQEIAARQGEDRQDAEVVRIAAFAGLRRGELVALKWRDVDLAGRKLTVRRTVSGTRELDSTKTRQARQVPIPDQAEAAFARLLERKDFTDPDDYVFVNRLGRRLDPSALRRRYERAREATGLKPLRFHDLRHTYGSLLVAGGIDLVSVKAAMGHSRISTTERYLHARSAGDQAERFSRALEGNLTTRAA